MVNTLELMGFAKEQIEECLPQLTREEMSNAEAAVSNYKFKCIATPKKSEILQAEPSLLSAHNREGQCGPYCHTSCFSFIMPIYKEQYLYCKNNHKTLVKQYQQLQFLYNYVHYC